MWLWRSCGCLGIWFGGCCVGKCILFSCSGTHWYGSQCFPHRADCYLSVLMYLWFSGQLPILVTVYQGTWFMAQASKEVHVGPVASYSGRETRPKHLWIQARETAVSTSVGPQQLRTFCCSSRRPEFFLALTQWLAAVCNSSSREFNTLFWPRWPRWALDTHVVHKHAHLQNTHVLVHSLLN